MEKLTKEQFVSYINFIKKKHEDEMHFCTMLEEISNNAGYCEAFIYTAYEDLLVQLLTKVMDDYGEWIGYWLYECDYGETFEVGDVTLQDGTTPDITTPEQLYDFILSENAK